MEEKKSSRPAPHPVAPAARTAASSGGSDEPLPGSAAGGAGRDPGDGAEPGLEGGEQHRAGLDPRHQRVATLLTQLATTARSFLLYDAHNEAINRFLTALLDGFVSTLREEGQLNVVVHPFELYYQDEPVYLNRDRERSLAFRLYRDGVRALKFSNGFDWEEMARLLEILSIRYTGVHQHEDDVVTLLWKANFKHLDIVAVEGFVPEDADESEAGAAVGAKTPVLLPADFDLPRPALPRPGQPGWVAVSEETQQALRDQASAGALPDDCLQLLGHMRRLLDDPREQLSFSEVAHLFTEIRDFLLADEHVGALTCFLRLVRELAEAPPPAWDAGRTPALVELLHSCGDDRAVRRLLHSVPVEEREPRPELVEVLDASCLDPLAAVADALAVEQAPAARAVGRQLLVRYGTGHADLLRSRFEKAKGHVAVDLMKVIAQVGGEGSALFCAHQVDHPEPEIQQEAVHALELMPYSRAIGRALFEAYRRAGESHRRRVLALMARSRDHRFVEHLAAYVEEHAAGLDVEEAAVIGKVMGQLGGAGSLAAWQEWLKPSGLLRKEIHGPLARQVAAASALGEIPGEEAAHALRSALVAASAEAEPWIGRSLSHHQRDIHRKATP